MRCTRYAGARGAALPVNPQLRKRLGMLACKQLLFRACRNAAINTGDVLKDGPSGSMASSLLVNATVPLSTLPFYVFWGKYSRNPK